MMWHKLGLFSCVFSYSLVMCGLIADATPQSGAWFLYVPPICWQAFQESICHCLQKYCLNYSAALLYLDNLKPREDFGIYVKVWEENHWATKLCAWVISLTRTTWTLTVWQAAWCQVWERTQSSTAAWTSNTQLTVTETCQREECDRFSHMGLSIIVILMYLSAHSVCLRLFHCPSPPLPLCSNKEGLFHPSDLLFPPLTPSLFSPPVVWEEWTVPEAPVARPVGGAVAEANSIPTVVAEYR